MEFVGEKCYLCGKKFGNRKPKSATTVEPFPFEDYRMVTTVAPCPSCGKAVPVWLAITEAEPPTEPAAPEPKPEPEPEPEPEP